MSEPENPGGKHWWAALIRRLRGGAAVPGQRKPFVRRSLRYTSLQFTPADAQSRMLNFDPDRLLVDYTRTMMGALLFRPDPQRIGMVGLGGGSQAKFCRRHLPRARTEVIEINPHVIALRRKFKVPEDDAGFRVLLGDAAAVLPQRRGAYDLLLVDGYDETGIPAALSTQTFYDACRDALAPGGAMAGNLYCDNAATHLERLRRAFGPRVLVVEEARMSNRVVFAWRDGPVPGVDAAPKTSGLSASLRRELGPVLDRVAGAFRRASGSRP